MNIKFRDGLLFTFQGAYVYNIDLTKGFTLKGRISHISKEDYDKAGQYWYDSDKNVSRIMYINDTLYTLSNNMIKANALDDLKEMSSLDIPQQSSSQIIQEDILPMPMTESLPNK